MGILPLYWLWGSVLDKLDSSLVNGRGIFASTDLNQRISMPMSNDVELGRCCQERVSPCNKQKMNNITSRLRFSRMLLTVEISTVFRYHSICHAAMVMVCGYGGIIM